MIKDSYGNTRFFGIYRGVVFDTNDPLGRARIRVKVPQVLADNPTEWAWPIGTSYSAPSVGDGVLVQFEGGDPSYPLWNTTIPSFVISGEVPPNTVVTQAALASVAETGLPEGGATGQVLSKIDSKEYSAEWVDTVTSIIAGTGLSGGTITTSGTISLANTSVTAASYGSETQVGTFIVNARGQLTAASNTSIQIAESQVTGLSNGYRLNQVIKLTSTTAFTKASYSWLRAVKVICVGGGGGGGGGAATSSTQTSIGGPGGGGGYSEAFITNLATLSATMYGVVGAGGNGGAVGANAGSAGTATWFGSSNTVSTGALVIANAGGGGVGGTLGGGNQLAGGTSGATVGTVPTANDLALPGGGGTGVWGSESTITASGSGGNSGLGYGSGGIGRATATSAAGDTGKGYGGGGSGAAIGRSTTPGQAGGAGSSGIVILELYA